MTSKKQDQADPLSDESAKSLIARIEKQQAQGRRAFGQWVVNVPGNFPTGESYPGRQKLGGGLSISEDGKTAEVTGISASIVHPGADWLGVAIKFPADKGVGSYTIEKNGSVSGYFSWSWSGMPQFLTGTITSGKLVIKKIGLPNELNIELEDVHFESLATPPCVEGKFTTDSTDHSRDGLRQA